MLDVGARSPTPSRHFPEHSGPRAPQHDSLDDADGSTTLLACHSLISDLAVIDSARFRPIVGRIEPIESEMFAGELTAMLPRFIALAFSESKP